MATIAMAGDVRKRRLGRLPVKNEPNWITGDLKIPCGIEPMPKALRREESQVSTSEKLIKDPIQQSNLLKPLTDDITMYGLNYAYQSQYEKMKTPEIHSKTKKRKEVIVVGAGMAGLVAAYELEQVGHDVIVLESQDRVGGRVHTLRGDCFDGKLQGEAGAMRLPCSPEDENKTHFLTDFYARHFGLTLVEFANSCDEAYLKFYNMKKAVKIKDWKKETFDELWPGWNDRLKEKGVTDIDTIDDYYDRTIKVVTDQLRIFLYEYGNHHEARAWGDWIDIWSQFSLDNFLQSTYEIIMLKVKGTVTSKKISISYEKMKTQLEDLDKYLPWPRSAVTAYSVFSYTEQLDQSLVQYLRDQLGDWWSKNMHRIKNGMYQLPEAFANENTNGWNKDVILRNKIQFKHTVNEIEYTFHRDEPSKNRVKVKAYDKNRVLRSFEGDAVIVAVPFNILRQITFSSTVEDTSPPLEFYKAIEDIFTGPATKIFLQTKTRFWEKKDGIKGGFSKTNLPIGQIHYQDNYDDDSEGEKGMLLIYTWKTEALLFGCLEPHAALREAKEQIATIHPEIEEQFEEGKVWAWYDKPSAQGAYTVLKPNQFQNVRWLLYPMYNIFFAGEGLSFASGWIQGALESGLRAAYQFYIRNESDWRFEELRPSV
ncbi:putative L-amino-acid oxidase YobN [Montipora capricornis]|uniref:putative L-amino-acid oxidase YobN n=1 Tax=Montipora capricornis TaxID=246305 RepID=UPI0035F16F10